MFPTDKNSNNFFKPYREQLNKSQHFQQQFTISQSPRKNYTMRNQMGYSPGIKNSKENLFERSAFHKRNMTEVDHQRNIDRSPSYNLRANNQIARYGDGKQQHQPTWEYLYSFGVQKRRALEQRMQKSKNKLDRECTFEPMIRKTSRYLIPDQSNFLQRNRIWHENKIQKLVKQKEEQVTKGLQDCTFKPKINTSYKAQNRQNLPKQSLPSHSKSKNKISPKKLNTISSHNNLNNVSENPRKNVEINRQEVGKIRNLIRKQLKRIQL